MKAILYSVLFMLWGCAASTNKKKKDPPGDSLHYSQPAVSPLTNEEFSQYYNEVKDYFDSALLKKGFNGGFLVALHGAVIFESYNGHPDLRKNDTMTAASPLHIASTSKTFTSIAILRLVQQGRLRLNDSLATYFPGIPYPGITIKMLLNHRSGLPNYVHYLENNGWDKKTNVTNQDVANSLYILQPPPDFKPDRGFSYCNTNFVLLAMIIEKITGQPYPDYMRKTLFEPLQMRDTYVWTKKDSAKSIPSFAWNNNIWQPDFLDITYGDKNIYSTPRDLLKWDQALYTDQLVTKALLDSAFTPYSHEKPSIHNYGLGWRLMMLPNGKKVIYHNGRWHGFNSFFARLTDEKATIIILGNKFNGNIYRARKMYSFFGDYGQNKNNGREESDDPELQEKKNSKITSAKKMVPVRKGLTKKIRKK